MNNYATSVPYAGGASMFDPSNESHLAYARSQLGPDTSYGTHVSSNLAVADYSKHSPTQGKPGDMYGTFGKLAHFGHSSDKIAGGLAGKLVPVDVPVPVKKGGKMPHLEFDGLHFN